MYSPSIYINREISWLQFNQRVLHEALDTSKDPISRLIFSAIFSNNLDEFFMIRVGGLVEQLRSGYNKRDIAGLTPAQQLAKIRQKVLELTQLQAEITRHIFEHDLPSYGIKIVEIKDLTERQLNDISVYFEENIYPVLTPIAIDPNRPFPFVLNKSLNILFKFSGEVAQYATLQVPSVLSRLLLVDQAQCIFVPLEDVIMYFSGSFFKGMTIAEKGFYRPTRNADITLNQEVAEDLLSVIEESLDRRKHGEVVRIEVDSAMPMTLINYLKKVFDCNNHMVYFSEPLIDLTFLFDLGKYRNRDDIYSVNPVGIGLKETDLFKAIEARDYLLHHPFNSFDTIIELIDKASRDPAVLAIKQVLYRVSGDSPIVKALSRAAKRGKQVTVVLELMARFDEANNILWAKQLEKNGCHVVFGFADKKTHAKLTLIVRREVKQIKRYVHISSGNYNDKTAKLYTDIGMLTCDDQIADDASKIFNMLSGFQLQLDLQHLIIAPNALKKEIIAKLEREISWAEQGYKAKFVGKFNALVDKEVIDTLYRASSAGVEIILIVRGICCLVAGLENYSRNIRVISVVDDLLEHSRLYWFHNNGAEDIYVSSADCMPRNLIRRVELMTPVRQTDLKAEIIDILTLYINCPKKARYMTATGHYVSAVHLASEKSAQKALVDYYQSKNNKMY